MKLVIFGLTLSTPWSSGHPTLWRGLCHSFVQQGYSEGDDDVVERPRQALFDAGVNRVPSYGHEGRHRLGLAARERAVNNYTANHGARALAAILQATRSDRATAPASSPSPAPPTWA